MNAPTHETDCLCGECRALRLDEHVARAPVAAIAWDAENRVVCWNAHAERLFGWAAAEVLGKTVGEWRFVHDEDLPAVERLAAEVYAARAPSGVWPNRNYTKSGQVRWCEWHNSVLYDPRGRVASVLSLVLDVTALRTTAAELERSQARVRAALDGADMLAWDYDLVANRWESTFDLAEFHGLPRGPDYTDPQRALDAIHPDDVSAVLAARRWAVESGEPMRYEFRGRVPAADGRPRWFSTRGQVLRDPDGRPVRIVAVTTEVTDRKRTEELREALGRQLQDAAKWESLRILAGGVAHDFNNILTVILGSANLARRGLGESAPAAAYLSQIEQSCSRAADLCRQMLAYSGRTQGEAVPLDLAALVREAVATFGGRGVRAEVEPHLPPVRGNPGQVRQVLANLLTNAIEARGDGPGEVVVRAAAAEGPAGEAAAAPDDRFHLVPPPGRCVGLTVSDPGPGISAEVRARMFDPFFSTKFTGRGLGLAAVLGIVRGHGGGIQVDSAPGRGAAVTVYWPAVPADPPDPDPAVARGPDPAARADAVALVIDDEMFVREVTASTLEDMGYAPVLAADGASGLELFHRHRGAVRLAVVDVVMPGMNGDQVLRALRLFAPRLPVVLVSGFTDRRSLGADPGTRTAFLQKPFHPEDLAAVVRRLTDEKG